MPCHAIICLEHELRTLVYNIGNISQATDCVLVYGSLMSPQELLKALVCPARQKFEEQLGVQAPVAGTVWVWVGCWYGGCYVGSGSGVCLSL